MNYAKIVHADCIKFMTFMTEESIDLIITSPPYDDLRDYKGNKFTFQDFKQIAKGLYKVIKPGGVVVWVVSDETKKGSETGSSIGQASFFMELGFYLHDTMIYLKDNPVPVGGSNRYYQAWEYMLVFSKRKPKTFNPLMRERRNKYKDKRTERIKAFNRDREGNFIKKRVSLTGNVKRTNVWKYTVGGGNSVKYGEKHPAVFPEKLAEDHILSWSNPDDIIFDPMCGSGTVGRMAVKHNRNFVGCDIVKEYCVDSFDSMEEVKKKLNHNYNLYIMKDF